MRALAAHYGFFCDCKSHKHVPQDRYSMNLL